MHAIPATLQIRAYHSDDETAVVDLWRRCDLTRPWNDPHRDIQRKQQAQPEMFLVGLIDGQIVASVMAGYEGHRGWINYLSVHPDYRRQGLGRSIMAEAERLLREVGCPKINLQIRASNKPAANFYAQVGYSEDDVISMGKRTEDDGPTGGTADSQ